MALTTRWKIWKLKASRRKLSKEYDCAAKKAKQKKDDSVLDEWYGLNGWQFDVIDGTIKENLSRDVLGEAEKLYLPTPSVNDKDKWVLDDELGGTGIHWQVLTPEVLTELNKAIRQEKRARLEVWELRAKIIGTILTSLIGVIGTIIGLVAIWKK